MNASILKNILYAMNKTNSGYACPGQTKVIDGQDKLRSERERALWED